MLIIPILLGLSWPLSSQLKWTKVELEKNFYSGVPLGCCDLNGDALDDLLILDNAKHLWVGYNYGSAKFIWHELDYHHFYPAWSINCGDIDRNGFNDILISGESTKVIALYQYASGFVQRMVDEDFFFSQSAVLFDFNQDGWLDFTICDDNKASKVYLNDRFGNLLKENNRIPLSMTDPNMEAGNYGCIWTDLEGDGDADLYISKCRPGVEDSSDLRRVNQLFINTNGIWKESAAEKGLGVGDQSWTSLFEDFDNDGDKDCLVVNHYTPSRLFKQNPDHTFTEFTQAAGLNIGGVAIQAIPSDFDNDGDLDILIAGSTSEIWLNDGSMNFSRHHANVLESTFSSCAVADFNSDGFIDILTSYANLLNLPSNTKDALWINPGNNNHYVQFILKGISSNTNGIGTQINVFTGSRMQSRELHAGESFGIQNSLSVHFGLGSDENIDSVRIIWPSGHIDFYTEVKSDRLFIIEENKCMIDLNRSKEFKVYDFCRKIDTFLIADPSHSDIKWNNGEETDTLQISKEGIYFYSASSPDGCSYLSVPFVIRLDPKTNHILSQQYNKLLCEGETIELTFEPFANATWSDGSSQNPLIIDQPGQYYAIVEGLCNEISTDTLLVHYSPIPEKPVIKPDTIIQGGKASLLGPDQNTYWYNDFNDINPLFVGENFITDSISSSRYFFAEWRQYHPYPSVHGGMSSPVYASNPYHASFLNSQMIFEVYQDVILDSVSLYTDDPGQRIIDLLDNLGQRIDSVVVNLDKGINRVYLGFQLSAKVSNYILTTNIRSNQMVFGENSPRLYRSDRGFYYPFYIEDKIKIISSDKGDSYYYYFFDWVIRKADHYCTSDRVEIAIIVLPNATDQQHANEFQVIQKPGQFKIQYGHYAPFKWKLISIDGKELYTSKGVTNEWIYYTPGFEGLKFAQFHFSDGQRQTIVLMPSP